MTKVTFTKDNTPNAARLMSSLRHSGYDNNIALSDLVDNSLDANASNVEVIISDDLKSEKGSITIVDDGVGMNEEILAQALRLGSLTHRDIESDLGRFGMGMVTASISIARRIEVYTKIKGGDMLVSIMDLDEMERSDSFTVYREKATTEEKHFAESLGLKGNGTVLILRKCDQLTRPNVAEFGDSLRKDFGETYRYFVRSGKKLVVNRKPVEIIDPMWQDGVLVEEYKSKSEIYSDETFELKIDGSEKIEQFTAKIYILPEFDRTIMRKLKIGIKTQGFYVLRNYRQIAKSDDLNGLWEKHNDLNRVRVELLFSGSLDDSMGVNYTKHNIKPNQAVLDKIQNDVMVQVDSLRNRFKKQHLTNQSKDLDFGEAEKIISQKNKLLDKAEPDKKDRPANLPPKRVTRTKTDHVKDKPGKPSLSSIARFETHDFGATGPIFEVEKQGKISIIQWNISHPFYQRFILEYKENKDLLNAVSFLAYSLGEAKLKYSSEETYEMLENIMSTISTNLRVLLS